MSRVAIYRSKAFKPKVAVGMLLPIKILENYKKQIADSMPVQKCQTDLGSMQHRLDYEECLNRLRILDEAIKKLKQ